MKSKKTIKYIDLFAGLGGIRLGFKQAFEEAGFETNCVLTAEIKTAAVKALTTNFGMRTIQGDVTTIDSSEIPDFDFLLAEFPCQAFSVAGKQRGFLDTRGTLFFEVERILREKSPYGFILENVEGLVMLWFMNLHIFYSRIIQENSISNWLCLCLIGKNERKYLKKGMPLLSEKNLIQLTNRWRMFQ